jgi:hypothetical protein
MTHDQCTACVFTLLTLVSAILVFFAFGGTCQFAAALTAIDSSVIKLMQEAN